MLVLSAAWVVEAEVMRDLARLKLKRLLEGALMGKRQEMEAEVVVG